MNKWMSELFGDFHFPQIFYFSLRNVIAKKPLTFSLKLETIN